jgi:hypothetical protein
MLFGLPSFEVRPVLIFARIYYAFVGYTGLDYQVAATLEDKGELLKVTGAHAIDTRQAIAAEVARPTTTEDAPTLITIA